MKKPPCGAQTLTWHAGRGPERTKNMRQMPPGGSEPGAGMRHPNAP